MFDEGPKAFDLHLFQGSFTACTELAFGALVRGTVWSIDAPEDLPKLCGASIT